MNGKILVACVGNIFLGDDAFGIEVARRLASITLPENVLVRDFGIRSYDLAYALMKEWDLAILVDTLPRGGTPGTIYTMAPELPCDASESEAFDAHTMNPASVLQLVNALGGKIGRLLVVGCEPVNVDIDESGTIGLSPPVQAALDSALSVIQELITTNSRVTAA